MMWDFSGGGNNGVPPYSPIPYSEDQYQPYAGPSMGAMPPFPTPGANMPPPTPFMPIGVPSASSAMPLFPAPSYASNGPGYAPQSPYPRPSNQQSKPSKPHSTWTSSKLFKPVWAHWGTDASKSESRPKPTSGGASGSAPVASTSHGHHSEPQQETFQYSRCTGKKKALCIGINYRGQANQLSGCVNDAKTVRRWLIRYHHFKDDDIILLVDDGSSSRQPTKANIINAMKWLVKGANPHDSLFLHYSGHGGQIRDLDGDEVDGLDEVIFPVDYLQKGFIVDDEMHKIMVKPLPPGCRLTALFDSCHSGSILDLPYLYHTNGRVKGSQVNPKFFKQKSTKADVISFSACKDYQTSADTVEAGIAVGAMSYAFITSMKSNPGQSYQDLLKSVREVLRKRYSQKPQLSSSHKIDTKLQFII